MTDKTKTKFEEVYSINVNDFTEKKNGLTYLSWAHAAREMTKAYPKWKYKIRMNESLGLPVFGNSEIGYMVYTDITVDDETKDMWLPVLDYKNQPVKNLNVFHINSSVMRCLTKNTAMFGVGLYIYAGEDLPEETQETTVQNKLESVCRATTELDPIEQKQMYDTALMLINACAEEKALNKLFVDNGDKWKKKLTPEQVADIRQAKENALTNIRRENAQNL